MRMHIHIYIYDDILYTILCHARMPSMCEAHAITWELLTDPVPNLGAVDFVDGAA